MVSGHYGNFFEESFFWNIIGPLGIGSISFQKAAGGTVSPFSPVLYPFP